jgi:hypothetical protein
MPAENTTRALEATHYSLEYTDTKARSQKLWTRETINCGRNPSFSNRINSSFLA